MEMRYFIDDNIDGGDDLPAGVRVIPLPVEMILKEKTAEGPFNSMKEVRSSQMFKRLLRENPKRAAKIFEKEYLSSELVDLPCYKVGINEAYEKFIYTIVKHSILGTVKKEISGIHLETKFNPNIRVLKESEPDKNGVWKADIEVLNQNSGKWIKKFETNFFPKEWSSTLLISECEHAYSNQRKITETRYESLTESGIPVRLIYTKEQILKTIYPIFVE